MSINPHDKSAQTAKRPDPIQIRCDAFNSAILSHDTEEPEYKIGEIMLKAMLEIKHFLEEEKIECDTGRKIHAIDQMVSAYSALTQGLNISRIASRASGTYSK